MLLFKFSQLLWLLVIFHLFANSLGMFPMFENFFNKFRNNRNGHHFFGGGAAGVARGGAEQNGGVSIFSTAASTGHGNVTSITVPMLSPALQRRVGIITTVITNAAAALEDDDNATTLSPPSSSSLEQIDLHQNVTTETGNLTISKSSSEQQVASSSNTNQRSAAIPTTISVTSSISASQQGVPVPVPVDLGQQRSAPNTLTLPFTPNLFGMMSYVQAMKDIKRNYKDQEKERKMALFNKQDGGDLMTRILRTLIQKVVNKYQKHTEILRLKILKRQDKLQNFLQLPMVSQVIATDQARAAAAAAGAAGQQPIHHRLGNAGAGVLVPHHHPQHHLTPGTAATSQVVVSRSGKPVHSILNSFLI